MAKNVHIEGMKEFSKDIENFPQELRNNGGEMMRNIEQIMQRSVESEVPVDTGELKAAHIYSSKEDRFTVEVDESVASAYGISVHEGTGRMRENPWLDRAFQQSEREIEQYQAELLEKATQSLAD